MIRGLFGVAVFVLAIHIAALFLAPSVKNTMLQGKMEDVSKNHTLRVESDVRRQVMEFILEKKIPLRAEDVAVRLDENGIAIAAHYKVTSRFWFYERENEFSPASSPEARKALIRVPQARASRRTVRAGH